MDSDKHSFTVLQFFCCLLLHLLMAALCVHWILNRPDIKLWLPQVADCMCVCLHPLRVWKIRVLGQLVVGFVCGLRLIGLRGRFSVCVCVWDGELQADNAYCIVSLRKGFCHMTWRCMCAHQFLSICHKCVREWVSIRPNHQSCECQVVCVSTDTRWVYSV